MLWFKYDTCTQHFAAVMNRLLSFLVVVLVVPWFAHAVSVEVTTDPTTIANSKKIWMLLKLEPNEQGVNKQGLCFSVDNPSICLTAWKPSIAPSIVYSSVLHRQSRMFLPGTALCLNLDANQTATGLLENSLAQSHVFVHGLVTMANGKLRPFSIKTPLGALLPSEQAEPIQQPATLVLTGTPSALASQGSASSKQPGLVPVADVMAEFDLITRLTVLWESFMRLVHKSMASFGLWLAAVLALIALIVCKRRYHWLRFVMPLQGVWEREFLHLLIFFAGLGVMRLASLIVAPHVGLYAAAAWCGGGMLFANLTPPFEETFLGRLKSLLGFIMGMTVLPLLTKAWLLQMGLG